MQDHQNRTAKRKGRWMKVTFGLSLVLNFAFVGFFAGAVLRHEGGFDRATRAPGLTSFGAPYVRALDREDRRAVLQALRGAPRDGLPSRHIRREMFEEVLSGLRAEPFDADALRHAVERQAGASVSVQQNVQNAWLEVVTTMSDDRRRAYATAVEEALRKGGRRH